MADVETLRVLHLALGGALIAVGEYSSGEASRVVVPLRAIVAEALRLDSAAVILAHDHLDGDPSPSASDIAATRRIAAVIEPLGIRIHDHIITAGSASFSFRAAGLL